MKDKEKQLEELAKEIFNTCAWRFGKPNDYKEIFNDIAEDLTKLNYRKLSKDSVVLTKSEKKKLLKEMYEQGKFDALADLEKDRKVVLSRKEYFDKIHENYFLGKDETRLYYQVIKIPQERKETAEKIYTKLKDSFLINSNNRYALKLWIEEQFNIKIKD